MDAAIKEQWVTALRSGDYQQGKGILRRQDGTYCCLGVLCELAVKAGVIEPAVHDPYTGVMSYSGESSVLPIRVMKWADLETSNPRYNDLTGFGKRSLSMLNDHLGAPFAEIADIIEEYV